MAAVGVAETMLAASGVEVDAAPALSARVALVVWTPPLPLMVAEIPAALARSGSCVMSTSCVPSGMGPLGLAGHEPGGLTGVDNPKGIVPAPPTCVPPTKAVWFAPWNWHWNSPLSSRLFGACWQYGTAFEVGFTIVAL